MAGDSFVAHAADGGFDADSIRQLPRRTANPASHWRCGPRFLVVVHLGPDGSYRQSRVDEV
jgi:hypothetical protein